nr:N-acetylmuramic acid 6-phosphate etherase [Roseibium hamelinense]
MAVQELRQTEQLHGNAIGLDTLPPGEIAAAIVGGQAQAVAAVDAALTELTRAADLMVEAMRGQGRLIYAAAGSSGLMALADAAELSGTYGIAPDRILFFMAGGVPVSGHMPGHTEDDREAAGRDAEIARQGDVVIALTASGTTPYPVEFASRARSRGAKTICLANNHDAQIFAEADVAVCLPTPAEIVAGSTRLGAATAQKAALNTMSTLMGVRLGHVHDGMMVNLVADNEKLRERAANIVSRIAGVDLQTAFKSLETAKGEVKPAVLIARGAPSLDRAQQLLADTEGYLRTAIARL